MMAKTLTPSKNPDRKQYMLELGIVRYENRKPAFTMPIQRSSKEGQNQKKDK